MLKPANLRVILVHILRFSLRCDSCFIANTDIFPFLLDGYQTTDVWYKWNPRDDNTSAIYVNQEVELPQFELASVEKASVINKYNIGNYASNDNIT